MRWLPAAVLGALVVVVLAAPAGAGPIIDDADAIELANSLVDATDEHGICYGWDVSIDDRGTPLRDVGSNLGPGVGADEGSCDRYIIFQAFYRWTPETSEAEDSVSYRVVSNVADAPTEADLRQIGIDGGDLLDRDDVTVYNATLALPALAAEAGLGPALPLEENTGTIPRDIGPDQTGSDLVREHGWALGAFGITIVAGLIWLVHEAFLRPSRY